ncbi:class V chitinase-like protein [Chaetomium tenue]|uniref:Class V chitinase-like protein n=1 Tax=Chaetomium tenue TaxID=1854479 RepID=A0ACB7PLF7_9PEZI|nr:class V chitinase-like protein [Chaetomium globosum]
MGTTCSYIQVQAGDSCASLVSRCGITSQQFYQYNPSPTLCSTLALRQPVCCSEGTLPDLRPQKNPDGTCFDYTVKSGDYCAVIADHHYLTVADIEKYNLQTWGWTGCNLLQLGANICLSPGYPPMPSIVDNTVCGPQVSGSARPADWATISLLNPCPLNACCNIWGQCGITPEFCTPSKSSTGAPGTAAPGTNGCISNCGTDITNNERPPSQFLKIGYFEGFSQDRQCLTMRADQIPTGRYTHVHFAFGDVANDYTVDLSKYQGQFEIFSQQTNFKRILSFGGWSFSTDIDSYPIFRKGVTDANRLKFARSVASVVQQYNLDGVDFDWEYPGADIPGIPPGSASDGPNYLAFLKTMRSLLPAGKTLSIAAPASFFYLKGFPISEMAPVLDYIVFMTYDLHGQWDYDHPWSQDGCPGGNCLRSHVNITETNLALAMITKAGVPAHKITVGIASYGRSFRMASPGCTGPDCHYTGPESGARPSVCTNTAGYISQAELELALSLNLPGYSSWYDAASDSDMMTYGSDTWVAYLSDKTKASRVKRFQALNFGGFVEWAIDLAAFVDQPDPSDPPSTSTGADEIPIITPVMPTGALPFPTYSWKIEGQ